MTGIISLRLVPFCHNTAGNMWCTSRGGWVRTAGVDSHWRSQHISRLWKRLRHDPQYSPFAPVSLYNNRIIQQPPLSYHAAGKEYAAKPGHRSRCLAAWTPPRLQEALPSAANQTWRHSFHDVAVFFFFFCGVNACILRSSLVLLRSHTLHNQPSVPAVNKRQWSALHYNESRSPFIPRPFM